MLVVIVCYRVTDLTIDCLRSLDQEIRTIKGARAVVCDNGTGGDSAERIAAAIRENGWSDWCELKVLPVNLGFTGGNNRVIDPAMASDNPPDYVLLLNADTIIYPGSVKTLLQFMKDNPKIGIAGNRLEYPDGTPGPSPFRDQGIVSEFDRGLGFGPISRLLNPWNTNPPIPTSAQPVDWVSGACMLIRRDVLRDIGSLDEGYYTYFDDIDYCIVARRAGWPTWFVPESRIIHLEGMTTQIRPQGVLAPKRQPGYWFQARRRFFLKNYSPFYAVLVDAAHLTGLALKHVRKLFQPAKCQMPPHLFRDTLLQSVFFKGFRVPVVENPALMSNKP